VLSGLVILVLALVCKMVYVCIGLARILIGRPAPAPSSSPSPLAATQNIGDATVGVDPSVYREPIIASEPIIAPR
jgi:hypothetical protein